MKTFITLISLLSLQAFAGQVISLQPGQTLPLQNGDVVACMGQAPQPAPQVTVSCTLYTGLTATNGTSLPPFKGTATSYSAETAKQDAINIAEQKCQNYSAGLTFKLDGQYVNPCSNYEYRPGSGVICK